MVCARPTLERIAEQRKYNIQNAVITLSIYIYWSKRTLHHTWNDPAINFPKIFCQQKFFIKWRMALLVNPLDFGNINIILSGFLRLPEGIRTTSRGLGKLMHPNNFVVPNVCHINRVAMEALATS